MCEWSRTHIYMFLCSISAAAASHHIASIAATYINDMAVCCVLCASHNVIIREWFRTDSQDENVICKMDARRRRRHTTAVDKKQCCEHMKRDNDDEKKKQRPDKDWLLNQMKLKTGAALPSNRRTWNAYIYMLTNGQTNAVCYVNDDMVSVKGEGRWKRWTEGWWLPSWCAFLDNRKI